MRASLRIYLLVFLLALLVRVGGPAGAGLKEFPPGLWFDEGLNGVDAWNTLHGGGFKFVYPDVFPREPLLVWILSVALCLGGPKIIVMRLVTVFLGSFACVAFYGMLRAIYPERPVGFALAAAFVLATLHWHAWFSRLVLRTNLIPLVACLLVWAMCAAARATPRRRFAAWMGAGAVAALGFYVYLSWYFFLLVILVWFWTLAERKSRLVPGNREEAAPAPSSSCESPDKSGGETSDTENLPGRSLQYFALGAALVALPLLMHYLFRPEDLTGRPQAVSPLRDGVAAALPLLLRNARDVILMFGVRGDHVPTHNVPWSPVLDPVWFGLFAAGVVRMALDALRGADRDRRSAAWLAWLVCMSLPSVVTQTDSANTLRNLGATPAVAFLVACGWWWAFGAAQRLAGPRRRYATAILMAFLLWGAGFQVVKLWVRHARNPETAAKFANIPVFLAKYCQPDLAKSPIFIPQEFMNKSFEFLTIGREDIRAFDPVAVLSRPADGKARDHRVLCVMFHRPDAALRALFPNGRVEEAKLFEGERPFAWIFRIPAKDLLSPEEAKKAALQLRPAKIPN